MSDRTTARFALAILLLTVVAAPLVVWAYYIAFPRSSPLTESVPTRAAMQHSISLRVAKSSMDIQPSLQISRNVGKKSDRADYSTAIIIGEPIPGMKTFNNTKLMPTISQTVSIALVCPTFTAAAYHDAFYQFYRLYKFVPTGVNVTTSLNLLRTTVSQKTAISPCFGMTALGAKVKQSIPNANISILSDQLVDSGTIFDKNGNNSFDIVVLGHQEYVTQHEYDNLKKFVSSGGTMVLLDGNAFYAEVKYNGSDHTITLVKGHGWAFNGFSAWHSVYERWANETREWVGSNYLCYLCKIYFAKNPFGYRHHEENFLSNPNDVIIYRYRTTDRNHVIATYELNYKNGKVIGLGIYADDVEFNFHFERYFSLLLTRYAIAQ